MWKTPYALNAKFSADSTVRGGQLVSAGQSQLSRFAQRASRLEPDATSCCISSEDDLPSNAAQPSATLDVVIRPLYLPAATQSRPALAPQWEPADVTAERSKQQPAAAAPAPPQPSPNEVAGAFFGFTHIINLDQRRNPVTYLTTCLANAPSLGVLQTHVDTYGPLFDHIHVSAAISRLPKVADRNDPESWAQARRMGMELCSRLFQGCLSSCSVREIANATWALGQLHLMPSDALVAGVLRRLVADKSSLLRAGKAQEMANLAHGLARLDYRQDYIWDAISPLAQAQLPAFKSEELAALAWAYATIGHRDTPLFAKLADEAQAKIHTFSAWGLCSVAWAFATMNHHDAPFFEALGRALLRNLHACRSQGLANTIWAYARVYHHDANLFKALSDAALKILPSFRNQELCNVMWAHARLGEPASSPLFLAATVQALPRVGSFRPEELASTLWACAKLRHSASPALLDAVVAAALPLLPRFEPRQLCSMVYSCALLRHSDPVLFDSVAQLAARCMSQFTPQGLSVIVWAYAQRSQQDPLLLSAAARSALPQLPRFKAQELALLMWSLARLQHKDAALWRAAVPLVLRHVKAPRVHAKSVAMFAWVYAVHGQQYDEELFQVLGRAAVANMSQFTVHDMTMLVWAFSAVQHVYSHLYDVVAQRSLYMLHRFYSRDLATLTLAYAQMDHKSAYLYDAIGDCALHRREEFDDATWRKLMGALAILGYQVDSLLPPKPAVVVAGTAAPQPPQGCSS